MTHRNAVGLVAARSTLGEAEVDAADLLMAALRLRPDRIIWATRPSPSCARSTPSSMTTIHADSPTRAVEQLALLVLQGGSRLNREDVRHYGHESIDVFVQLERKAGRRKVAQVLMRGE